MTFSLGALLCAVSLLVLVGTASTSKADSRPYCMAFARDLANRKVIPPAPLIPPASVDPMVVNPVGDLMTATASISQSSDDEAKAELLWRRAYKSALKSCLEQYSGDQPKPKLIAPRATTPPKPIAKKVEEKQADLRDDGPKRGSDKWKKDCLAKHPSFNAETGTYRTWSGAQRECRL